MLRRVQSSLLLTLFYAPWILLPAMPLTAFAMWAFGW